MAFLTPLLADLRSVSPGVLLRESLRAGTVAGLAMMPFGAAFRAVGLRINEYGPKTLALIAGDLEPPLITIAGFAQHMAISWFAAPPLLILVARSRGRAHRTLTGAAYGAAFYVAVNSLALPAFFGDPTPWELGIATIAPSLIVHVVYGLVVAWMARAGLSGAPAR